jgi:hypothetical protein
LATSGRCDGSTVGGAETQLIAVWEKSTIAEAICYGFNHRDGFVRFLEDGRIEWPSTLSSGPSADAATIQQRHA